MLKKISIFSTFIFCAFNIYSSDKPQYFQQCKPGIENCITAYLLTTAKPFTAYYRNNEALIVLKHCAFKNGDRVFTTITDAISCTQGSMRSIYLIPCEPPLTTAQPLDSDSDSDSDQS